MATSSYLLVLPSKFRKIGWKNHETKELYIPGSSSCENCGYILLGCNNCGYIIHSIRLQLSRLWCIIILRYRSLQQYIQQGFNVATLSATSYLSIFFIRMLLLMWLHYWTIVHYFYGIAVQFYPYYPFYPSFLATI